MSFSFLQRGSLPDHARQLVLASDEPLLVLEGMATGIDNLRHDVYLSPKFSEIARQYICKLVARHGNVEELIAELGAAFISARCCIEHTSQAASYIEPWLRLLKKDAHALHTVARLAADAADYVIPRDENAASASAEAAA